MLYIKEEKDKFILPNEETIINKTIKLPNNKSSFVYFLIKDNQIIYIGKSSRGLERIFEHNLDFDELTFLEVPEALLDIIETFYLEKLTPACNTQKSSCNNEKRKLLYHFKLENFF